MRGKQKRNFQKLVSTILAIIIAIALVLGLAAPFFASETSSISIESKIGFEYKYKIGANTPFSILLKNDGNNFEGELQIKVYSYVIEDNKNYTLYSKNINLPQNSSQKIDFNLYLSTFQKEFEISLVQNGKVVATKTEICKPYSSEENLVAALTENTDNLEIFRKLKIRNDNNLQYGDRMTAEITDWNKKEKIVLGDALIPIDTKNFPNQVDVLKNFESLIIDNYNISKLDELQLNCVYEWLNMGGYILSDANSDISYILKDEMDSESLAIDIDGNNTSIQVYDLQNGKILKCNFEFSDLNGNSIEVLSNIYNSIRFRDYSTSKSSENFDNMRPSSYGLNHIPSLENNTTIKIIFSVIILYLILVVPISYLYLKRKDKLEKAWIAMISIALCATTLIYFISIWSPYKKPILSNLSFVNIDNKTNTASINTILGFLSPKSGNVDLKFEEDIENLKYIPYSYLNYYPYTDSGKENTDCKISLEKQPSVTFYDNLSWDLNTLSLDSYKKFKGNISASVQFNKLNTSMDISNDTGYSFENVLIIMGNLAAYCDIIEDGETKTLQFKEYNPSNYYDIIEEMLGDIYNSEIVKSQIASKQITLKDIQIKRKVYSILQNIFNSNLNTPEIGSKNITAKMYAFNNDNLIDIDMKIDNKYPNRFSQNIFVTNLEMEIKNSENFSIPKGVLKANNLYLNDTDGHLEISKDSININSYKVSTVNVDFIIPKYIDVTSFQIFWNIEPEIVENFKIYNFKDAVWENINNYYLCDSGVKNYISDRGIITIQATVQPMRHIEFPEIAVAGNIKN